MPETTSQAKIYRNVARGLVQEVCYRDIFNGQLCPCEVREARGQIDFESDYMRRIFFTCDGKEYFIRLWEIKASPSRTGRTKIDYSVFEECRCWRCDEEFNRDMHSWGATGGVLCLKCNKEDEEGTFIWLFLRGLEDLSGKKIEEKNEEQMGQQTTTTTNQE